MLNLNFKVLMTIKNVKGRLTGYQLSQNRPHGKKNEVLYLY